MEKLIVTAAVTGSAPTKDQNPAVPYSPAEIADETIRAAEAGAAIVHIHVRDPETGAPAFERHLFAEAVERIRARSEILINLTTSGFNIQTEDVGRARLMPLELDPDLCSLDVGSLNFRGGRVFINPEDWVEMAAREMRSAGIKPEVEAFDLGHVRQAKELIKKGLLEDPPYFQLCLGVSWGIEGDLASLLEMVKRLPEGCQWSALGVGPAQLPINVHTMMMGGHVRVGFEDNLYLAKGAKADSNARFVERIVELAGVIGRPVASPDEARRILNLPEKG